MSRKAIFIGTVTFLILFIPTASYAYQYYDQYPGNGFVPQDEFLSYWKGTVSGQIYHNDTSDGCYFCPVNFSVPDESTYFIKSIGMRFRDNRTDGHISIALVRYNLYTGGGCEVAIWNSPGASSNIRTASQGSIAGRKFVDTKKFSYFLAVRFCVDGDVNPSNSLQLHQVRIHYGT